MTEAKAYFGYQHKWLRPGLGAGNGSAPGVRHRSPPHGVAEALAAGTNFLLESRTGDGLWQDFSGALETPAGFRASFGPSDEWVSAYVACSLAGAPGLTARQAAQRAWLLLVERRMPIGGWGYNRWAPVDGDSTAWGLRLARAVGATPTPAARLGWLTVERHRLPDGGIATYLETDCPKPEASSLIPPDGSHAGWCSTSHPCVTAATAGLGDASARALLRRAQRADGSWASYWWLDDEYATALAAESLTGSASAADRAGVQAAVSWALERIASGSVEDSPFGTALALRTLALRRDDSGIRKAIVRTVRWLIERQDPDGGWASSARLIAPRPDVTDRDSSPVGLLATVDDARSFTAATVLSALTCVHHVVG
jgi:squalene cyclase